MIDKRLLVAQALPIMQKLHFVKWDRWMDNYDLDKVVIFYGWIDREKDEYKDFVEIDLFAVPDSEGYKVVFSTSSAEYSVKISKILGMNYDLHVECKRIELLFPKLPNVIKLEEGKNGS